MEWDMETLAGGDVARSAIGAFAEDQQEDVVNGIWKSQALRRLVMPALAPFLTLLAYLPSLSFQFVFDDHAQILNNPSVHSWRGLPYFFASHVWAQLYGSGQSSYYRPIFLVWLT